MSTVHNPMRLIAFAAEGVFSSVLESQVLIPLGHVGRHAPHMRRSLLILTGLRHRRNPAVPARQDAIRTALPDVPVAFRYRPPSPFPLERWLWARQLEDALQACGYTGPGPIVVHCRGETTAAAAAVLKRRDPRLRVLLDVRGATGDEIKGHGLRARYCRSVIAATQRRAFAGADALNTVSRKLAEHLRESGALTRQLPSTTVGCCADTARFYFDPVQRAARRRELGFADKFVVCYCGAMEHWQRPDAVAAAFAAVRRAMPNAHMFIVSREAAPLVTELHRVGIDDAHITARATTHDQVASFLMAADVGVLLRENTLTNRVASPVKFAEYLRCGLPVILTPYIGDISAWACQHGVGAAIDMPIVPAQAVDAARGIHQRLQAEGDAFRAACSRLAEAEFSWEVQATKLIALYSTLSAPVCPAPNGAALT